MSISSWAIWCPAAWTKKGGAEIVAFLASAGSAFSAYGIAASDENHKRIFQVAVLVCAIIALSAGTLAKIFEQWAKKAAEITQRERCRRIALSILRVMHETEYNPDDPTGSHESRITLFVCNEATPEKPKHLAIFARQGTYPGSTTTWDVNEDHPDRCEGVAGKAWFHQTTQVVFAARAWHDDDLEAQIAYTESQGITIEKASKLLVKSSTIVAGPVEVNGNKRWGVLVLDSLQPAVVPRDGTSLGRFKATFNHYSTTLGRVLSEALA